MTDPAPGELIAKIHDLDFLKLRLMDTSLANENATGSEGVTALLGLADLIIRLENLGVLPVEDWRK